MLTYQINKEVLDIFFLPHQLYTIKELKLTLLKKFNSSIVLNNNMKHLLCTTQKTMDVNYIINFIINNHQYKKKINYLHYDYYQIPTNFTNKIPILFN